MDAVMQKSVSVLRTEKWVLWCLAECAMGLQKDFSSETHTSFRPSFAAQGPCFDGAFAFDFDGAARFKRIAALELLDHAARDLNGIR